MLNLSLSPGAIDAGQNLASEPTPTFATGLRFARPSLRTSAIVITAVLLHVAGLWALQSGLLHRIVADVVVPAEVLVDISPADIEPAAPTPPEPPVPVAPPPPAPRTTTPQPRLTQALQTASTPLALPATQAEPETSELSPAPVPATAATNAPGSDSATNSSNANPPTGTAVAVNRAPAIELPSSDANYLNNPTPAYPLLSKRLGEQGRVVIRTLIGVNGRPEQAHIKQSSGFDRLDQAALATALKWSYAPGKRAGVAEAMWFDLPFTWVLR